MRTFAILKNFSSSAATDTISRNLQRILDIVILDMDCEKSSITFLHSSLATLEKAKRELLSIGFPIKDLDIQNGTRSLKGLSNTMGQSLDAV
jgi:hypothetical protein